MEGYRIRITGDYRNQRNTGSCYMDTNAKLLNMFSWKAQIQSVSPDRKSPKSPQNLQKSPIGKATPKVNKTTVYPPRSRSAKAIKETVNTLLQKTGLFIMTATYGRSNEPIGPK